MIEPPKTRKRGELLRQLTPLLSRAEGLTAREAAPVVGCSSESDAWSRLQKLAKRGEIFDGTKPGVLKRYFATAKQRDAWLKSSHGDRIDGPEHRQGLTVARKRSHGPIRVSGDVQITAQTKVTLDTKDRPTAAWQVLELAPDPRWPSFSSVPFGVNPDTGKAWEGRA